MGKSEVRATLRTKDLNEAQKRAKEVELEFDLAWKPMIAQIDKVNRPGFTGYCLVVLMRLYRVCSCLHSTPHRLPLV